MVLNMIKLASTKLLGLIFLNIKEGSWFRVIIRYNKNEKGYSQAFFQTPTLF